MAILVNILSGNGLFPDGTKPLLEPMLTYHQKGPVTPGTSAWKDLKIPINTTSLNGVFFKSQPDLPEAYELNSVVPYNIVWENIRSIYFIIYF